MEIFLSCAIKLPGSRFRIGSGLGTYKPRSISRSNLKLPPVYEVMIATLNSFEPVIFLFPSVVIEVTFDSCALIVFTTVQASFQIQTKPFSPPVQHKPSSSNATHNRFVFAAFQNVPLCCSFQSRQPDAKIRSHRYQLSQNEDFQVALTTLSRQFRICQMQSQLELLLFEDCRQLHGDSRFYLLRLCTYHMD